MSFATMADLDRSEKMGKLTGPRPSSSLWTFMKDVAEHPGPLPELKATKKGRIVVKGQPEPGISYRAEFDKDGVTYFAYWIGKRKVVEDVRDMDEATRRFHWRLPFLKVEQVKRYAAEGGDWELLSEPVKKGPDAAPVLQTCYRFLGKTQLVTCIVDGAKDLFVSVWDTEARSFGVFRGATAWVEAWAALTRLRPASRQWAPHTEEELFQMGFRDEDAAGLLEPWLRFEMTRPLFSSWPPEPLTRKAEELGWSWLRYDDYRVVFTKRGVEIDCSFGDGNRLLDLQTTQFGQTRTFTTSTEAHIALEEVLTLSDQFFIEPDTPKETENA